MSCDRPWEEEVETCKKWLGAKNITVLITRDRAETNSEAFAGPLRKAGGVWLYRHPQPIPQNFRNGYYCAPVIFNPTRFPTFVPCPEMCAGDFNPSTPAQLPAGFTPLAPATAPSKAPVASTAASESATPFWLWSGFVNRQIATIQGIPM